MVQGPLKLSLALLWEVGMCCVSVSDPDLSRKKIGNVSKAVRWEKEFSSLPRQIQDSKYADSADHSEMV